MNRKYSDLLTNLQKLFQSKQISIRKFFSELQYHDTGNLRIFASYDVSALVSKPINEAMDELFYMIQNEWKFFDYDLIDSIVKMSGCKEAEDLLTGYISEIDGRLNIDFEPHKPLLESISKGSTTKVLKIKCEVEKVSIKQWISIKEALKRCFHLPDGTLQFNNTISGSITLIAKISLQAKNYLLQLKITKRQLKPLSTMKIVCLTIDDEVILRVPLECNTEVIICNIIKYSRN